MSIYNDGVKTHIIDPVYFSNQRAEFRLESDKIYLTNWRMVNIGVTGVAGSKTYSGITGAVACIKNIALYDNNVLLDQILDVPKWCGFKSFNNSNADSQDLESNLRKSRMGNCLQGYDTVADGSKKRIDEWEVRPALTGKTGDSLATYPKEGDRAFLRLKDVFPILQNLNGSIDTSFFKELKIVVEFSDDHTEFMKSNDAPLQMTQPLLIVDEVVSENGKSRFAGFQGATYYSIENDRVIVPAITTASGIISNVVPTPIQQRTFNVNGFNNKTVGRILVVKTPLLPSTYTTGGSIDRIGPNGSSGMMSEEFQMRVGGASVLAGKGITLESEKLAYLTDTWGTCSVAPMMNGGTVYYAPEVENRGSTFLGGDKDLNVTDYIGLNVGKYVESLEIDYQRVGNYIFSTATVPPDAGNKAANDGFTDLSPLNQALEMNIFAEVRKAIVPVAGGGYSVVYN